MFGQTVLQLTVTTIQQSITQLSIVPPPPAKICSEGTAGSAVECTANEIADEDAIHWFCDVQSTMPNGDVAVSVTAAVYSVQVSWDGLDEDGNTQNRNVSAAFIP